MNLKIDLKWSYLKNEIDYETFKAAEITITDNNVKGEAQSDNTNADADFCRSKIDTAVSSLEELMHHHFLVTALATKDNQLTRNKQTWTLNLYYGDSERRVINLESLTNKCHRYIVNYVLFEWCKLALPDKVEYYRTRMSEEEQAIAMLVNRKEAPVLSEIEPESTTIDTTIEGLSATATVTQLEYGQAPTCDVTISKLTKDDGTLVPCFNFAFGIPKGQRGEKGTKGDTGLTGQDGIQGNSPTVDYDLIKAYIDQKLSSD